MSLMQQRSYSCGDISPTEEKWGGGRGLEEEGLLGKFDDEDLELFDQKFSSRSPSNNPFCSRCYVTPVNIPNFSYQKKDFRSEVSQRKEVRKVGEGRRGQRGEERMVERRKSWLREKQKSKSSDLSWSRGMWSPVEDQNKLLILVPKNKKTVQKEERAKIKFPAFFQMDSGSSYESTEHQDPNRKQNSFEDYNVLKRFSPKHAETSNHPPHPQNRFRFIREKINPIPPVLNKPLQLSPRQYLPSVPIESQRNPRMKPHFQRREWLSPNLKSHSLDSSFDEHISQGSKLNLSQKKVITASSTNLFTSPHSKDLLNFSDKKKSFLKNELEKQSSNTSLSSHPPNNLNTLHPFTPYIRQLDRRPLRPTDVLSRETSERLRISSEELKNMLNSPEMTSKINKPSASPRNLKVFINEQRRSNFSQQKSFSYDVSSLQPKTTVQCRKQSEPIMSNNKQSNWRGKFSKPSFPKSLDVPSLLNPPFHPPAVEIFITYDKQRSQFNSSRSSPSLRRQKYFSQRSQSCETKKKISLDSNKTFLSDHLLSTSISNKRDYLEESEVQEFQNQFLKTPKISSLMNQRSPLNFTSRYLNFLNQKSQSCEMNQESHVSASRFMNNRASARDLRGFIGYPRLLRQLAKSEIEVEPILEKDSSNSSKDAPEQSREDEEEKGDKKDSSQTQNQKSLEYFKSPKKLILSQQFIETSLPPNLEVLQKTCFPVSKQISQISQNQKEGLDFSLNQNCGFQNEGTSSLPPNSKLFSDGIVKWRRKLPQIDSVMATEKMEQLIDKNWGWVENKKLKFQENEARRKGIKLQNYDANNRRNFYGQQKSFSCENKKHVWLGTNTTFQPELNSNYFHPQSQQLRLTNKSKMLESKKKSHSLDEKAEQLKNQKSFGFQATSNSPHNNFSQQNSNPFSSPPSYSFFKNFYPLPFPNPAPPPPSPSIYENKQQIKKVEKKHEKIENEEDENSEKEKHERKVENEKKEEAGEKRGRRKEREEIGKEKNKKNVEISRSSLNLQKKRLTMMHGIRGGLRLEVEEKEKEEIEKKKEQFIIEKENFVKKATLSCRIPLAKIFNKLKYDKTKK